MIDEKTYLKMKELIVQYELEQLIGVSKQEEPYLVSYTIEKHTKYNPEYGDNRKCECGHSYYRHFDTYEGMDACGCKYCDCFTFKEKI